MIKVKLMDRVVPHTTALIYQETERSLLTDWKVVSYHHPSSKPPSDRNRYVATGCFHIHRHSRIIDKAGLFIRLVHHGHAIEGMNGREADRELARIMSELYAGLGNVNPSGKGMNGKVYHIDGKAPTVTTNKGEGFKMGVVQINPSKESNGVQPHQQNRIYDVKAKGAALSASLGPRYKVGFSDGNTIVYRKATPIECERLQTVPDNYTKGVSNTQRYKMLGNGWTVDVIAHILKNIPHQDIY